MFDSSVPLASLPAMGPLERLRFRVLGVRRPRRVVATAVVVAVVATMLSWGSPAAAQAQPTADAEPEVVLPPRTYTDADCTDSVPILVASDAAAQSDLYSAMTLAGVLGTNCVVLAGARNESMPSDQLSRLNEAGSGGFIVGGTAAVPESKVAGQNLTRLAGADRWHTARLVGAQALIAAGGSDSGTVQASAGAEDPTTDCTGDVAILVASDAAAQSDLYSAVTLAGVVGTDCIILTGPRDGSWPADQLARVEDASAGSVLRGYIVGGEAAVPLEKLTRINHSVSRIAGDDRWQTARLMGDQARRFVDAGEGEAPGGTDEDEEEAAVTFTEVSAGRLHTCALLTEGSIACWGLDNDGQSSPPEGTFTAVSAGGWHSCALRGDGTVECWGNNEHGQSDPPGGTFSAVSAGGVHTCGLKTDDRITCWGRNVDGQATPPNTGFRTVSAGYEHTCGLLIDNSFSCWGKMEGTGQDDFISLSATGETHMCAVLPGGSAICWGSLYGPTQRTIRLSAGPITVVDVGDNHACGIVVGAIGCWGDNSYGQLSEFREGAATLPTSGGTYVAVSAGALHTCGLTSNGRIHCWGANHDGQATPPTS